MSGNILKLQSADPGIKNMRIPSHQIECYFDVEPSTEEKDIETYIDEHQMELIMWGDRAMKVLKSLKNEKAKELVEEFQEIYDEFFEVLEEKKKLPEKYSIIKLHSQILYRVKETLEELDDMLEDFENKERFGDGFNDKY